MKICVSAFDLIFAAFISGGVRKALPSAFNGFASVLLALLIVGTSPRSAPAQATSAQLPPRAVQARRFMAQRGWAARPSSMHSSRLQPAVAAQMPTPTADSSTTSTALWQPLGPAQVVSPNFGLVTGRISSIALDPADTTGNRVFIGTTGGGVWLSQNAGTSNASDVVFTPLTDNLAAMRNAQDASISVGAITVQPGGTGVILVGTGDPNDALDSYYGSGILRSTDGGNTWSLIQSTADQELSFIGEGFAGFAWSTANPQLVVAAVSQAYEGVISSAERPQVSYEGLYYSTDSGATWSLAIISDSAGQDVQGPLDAFAAPHGNAATAVVWNPLRHIFIAAVRFHGYYQSADGITWTRMPVQPGTGLDLRTCPTNQGMTGSPACPLFRSALAVNPITGDTFAWAVNVYNQDQGLWQDQCGASGSTCTNPNVTFSVGVGTTQLQTNEPGLGTATIENGDYNLVLAAIPSAQDTLLLAGTNDVWKCSLAGGCVWRNTTNASTCMSAQVARYQHALAWNASNPQEMFVGNDSGLWRSMDAIGESGSVCSSSDSSHFQNLNAGLGSLAEPESIAQGVSSSYTMLAGLGVNGTAGVKSTIGPTAQWPQILGGEGGPVAIDPVNPANWYVNNAAGVSIHRCSQSGDCTAADFGVMASVTNADVSGDGSAMTAPAPFLVDPLDSSQLLIATCRLWRGPASGGWTAANAISPFLDGITGNPSCNGDALIRSIAAMDLPGGGEVVYAGMYGYANGGRTKAGHVFSATFDPVSGTWSAWNDLTLNPVTNDVYGMNANGMDISSIYIDPHDTTGKTFYVTADGIPNARIAVQIRVAYRSTDGGAHWQVLASNLPPVAANSIVVDPQDANTVYLATDAGVYSTRQITNCAAQASSCWSLFGAGLPGAPVVGLSAAPSTATQQVLVAATYGRGMWQIPLWTAGVQTTTATVDPASLAFGDQAAATTSAAQTVTLTNTGGIALTPASIATSGSFAETDNCANQSLNAGASCAIQVTFTPAQAGAQTGQLTISANLAGGQLTVPLSGNGLAAALPVLSPSMLSFGQVKVGSTSTPLSVTLQNAGGSAMAITSAAVTGPFQLAANTCGSSLAANSACQMTVEFVPTQEGSATGTLTVIDSTGTQAVVLSGSGASAATDSLSATSLSFPATATGQLSPVQMVTLTNSGGVTLTAIAVTASTGFQISNNCGTLLPGNASCTIGVQFAPTQTGTLSGTLTISDALRTQTVALSGTGVKPALLSVNPAQLSFSAQQIGGSGSTLALTVSNTGGLSASNIGFQMTGQSAASFSIGATTCGAILNSGASCAVQVTFKPTIAGANSAALTVSSSTLGVAPVQVLLSGTGQTTNGLNISPAQLSFIQSVIGQSSAAQTVTITNGSSITAAGLAVTVTAPFNLAQNFCGTSLAAGASCTVAVVFTPSASGTVAGTLTASSSTFTTPATAVLSGAAGAAGSVSVQPGQLNFSSTGVGAISSTQTVTITNTSSAVALTDLALSVSSGFQLSGNTCAATLAPGAACTAQVALAPATTGAQSGHLTVSSSALSASVQVPLSGDGFDFSAAPSGSPTQSVASGQAADYTLTLTPLDGEAATFTFKCGALPANTTCIFNPSTETVAANSTGSESVKIATGQSASSAQIASPSPWNLVPMSSGLLLLPLAWRRRRKLLCLVALLAIAVGGASSCSGSGGAISGSSSTPATGPTATPAGTYSIPVIISSNGTSHQVTLTLTVD